MNQLEFETKLNEAYSGTVQPLNRYLNKHAVTSFHCTSCGLKFFNSPKYMVGKDHQRHICHMPYGDSNGVRFATVPKRGEGNQTKRTVKKEKESKVSIDRLNEMIYEDYTYKQIAQEFKINPNIIKDHFVQEGLIEG
jgi:hypothetical protein